MRIAICDDEAVFRQEIKEQLQQELGAACLDTLWDYSSGEALLEADQEKSFDLVFLDIQLGAGLDGMEVAQRLRERNEELMIVFLTSYDRYFQDAFEIDAVHYLMKPIVAARFQRTLQRCRQRFLERTSQLVVPLYQNREEMMITGAKLVNLCVQDILYVEAAKRHAVLYTVQGDQYPSTMTLTALAERLQKQGFIYAHRSCLISLRYVHKVAAQQVVLATAQGTTYAIEVSRRQQKAVEAAVLQYELGKGKGGT